MKSRLSLALLAATLLSACDTKDDAHTHDDHDTDGTTDTDVTIDTDITTDTDIVSNCTVTPPAEWAAPSWDANTSEALALRAALDTLVTGMRSAEQGTGSIDELSDLDALFDAGSPSVSSITTAAYTAIVDDAFAEFIALLDVGALDLVDDDGYWTPGDHGGIFGPSYRGLNEGGLEVRQVVDKGLFGGGALYAYAVGKTGGVLNEATIDTIAAAWGTNSTLDIDGDQTDSATYSKAMGFYPNMKTTLIAAKAYVADPECTAEANASIVTAFRIWELSLVSRFVHYANVALEVLNAPSGDADLATALHELSEGAGLALGLYGVNNPTSGPLSSGARRATDADIDVMMTAIGVDPSDLGASTTGTFVSNPTGFATGVTAVETRVKAAYGVTDADIQQYREPAPE